MKKYKYIKLERGLLNTDYHTSKEKGNKSYRTVIDEMATRGYRYVGYIPCGIVGSNQPYNIDLVFEIDNENQITKEK